MEPVCPPTGVVVAIEAISIEGGDIIWRKERRLPLVPFVAGSSAVGTVTEVGHQASGYKVGDRVATIFSGGAYAEKRAIPSRNSYGPLRKDSMVSPPPRYFPLSARLTSACFTREASRRTKRSSSMREPVGSTWPQSNLQSGRARASSRPHRTIAKSAVFVCA